MSIRPAASSTLSSLRLLSLLFIGVPLAVYVAFGAYRYLQLREETELRLDRALRIAVEHALRVLDTSRARAPAGVVPDAAALASLSAANFQGFHRDLSADEPGMAITLFRQDGAVVSRWPALAAASPRLSPTSPVMTRVNAGETQGAAHGVSSLDGRARLLFFRRVGDYPVYLGTGMEVNEIRKRWLEEIALLAAFGIPPLVGLWFAARIALRRTRSALQAAQQLGQETRARMRVEEALLQAQKLEALGRLTGGVAHDFNNALMVVSNSLFLHQHKFPDAHSPHLDAIGRAVESATRLTRQLLAFSRRQALLPERFVLQERLPALQELIAPVLGGQVSLAIEVDSGTCAILVDAAELELALINLAINAHDAMPSGGSFRLAARNAPQTPPLLQGPMVVIEATDSGSGIAPHVLDKVFDPFFTTKPVGEGTGLGLSQVYGLCQRAGGTATVESPPGSGTTVRMFFPARDDAAAATAQPAPAPSRRVACSVLLVEDNDDVAATLQPVLESIGCTVVRKSRALEAREWLRAQAVPPQAVLTDVVMPGEMDGLGLARHLREHYPGIGVLLMTGYAEQMEAIANLGFTVLPKPCPVEVLAEAMENATAKPEPS